MRKHQFSEGEYYHVYNRGVEKRVIFNTENDYNRFLSLLYLCNSRKNIWMQREFAKKPQKVFEQQRGSTLVNLCAYCLMPNHFHLLIQEKKSGNLSIFMQKLSTAYTMYFNASNSRSGSLFQGTFKAEHANIDTYLKYLISYIHLNPLKLIEPNWMEKGFKDRKYAQEYLKSYKYSSYQDFFGMERIQHEIISKGSLPQYFESPITFKENIDDLLLFNG